MTPTLPSFKPNVRVVSSTSPCDPNQVLAPLEGRGAWVLLRKIKLRGEEIDFYNYVYFKLQEHYNSAEVRRLCGGVAPEAVEYLYSTPGQFRLAAQSPLAQDTIDDARAAWARFWSDNPTLPDHEATT